MQPAYSAVPCRTAEADPADPAAGCTRLRLDGRVRTPLDLGLHELHTLAQHTVLRRALSCAGRSLDPATGLRRWRGVRLTALLELAGIRLERQRERGAICVLAHGRDGYVASFSWSELFNGPGGEDVLVALSADGTALAAGDAPRLIAAHDWQSSARQVRGLCRIEVRAPQADECPGGR